MNGETYAEVAYMVLNEVFSDIASATYYAIDHDCDTITEIFISDDGRTVSQHIIKVTEI